MPNPLISCISNLNCFNRATEKEHAEIETKENITVKDHETTLWNQTLIGLSIARRGNKPL